MLCVKTNVSVNWGCICAGFTPLQFITTLDFLFKLEHLTLWVLSLKPYLLFMFENVFLLSRLRQRTKFLFFRRYT